MPEYKATVTPEAKRMLVAHVDFLEQASPEAAERLVLSFEKAVSRVVANPSQFPFADNLDAPDAPPKTVRKCLFEDRYKALFVVSQDKISIFAVIDCRMENNYLFAQKK